MLITARNHCALCMVTLITCPDRDTQHWHGKYEHLSHGVVGWAHWICAALAFRAALEMESMAALEMGGL